MSRASGTRVGYREVDNDDRQISSLIDHAGNTSIGYDRCPQIAVLSDSRPQGGVLDLGGLFVFFSTKVWHQHRYAFSIKSGLN